MIVEIGTSLVVQWLTLHASTAEGMGLIPANEALYSQSYGFSSSHVRMWELGHKEDWIPKNWGFRIVMLEKTLGQ